MGYFQLTRCAENPILKPDPSRAWEARMVLNPGALYEDGRFLLYYRAAGNDRDHRIYVGLAESTDGVHFTRVSDQPVCGPQENGFDGGCTEDPRLVTIDGVTYMTYAYRPFPPGQYWIRASEPVKDYGCPGNAPRALTENITSTGLAIVKNRTEVKKLGRITLSDVDDRDVMLFPEKIGGRFWRLSRPVEWSGEGYENAQPAIWINSSANVMDWDEKNTKLLMKSREAWEEKKIGAGAPPIRTEQGWLLLYHGVDSEGIYRVGAALLDAEDPARVLYRTRRYILQPETEYEKVGIYNGCVFPTGTVLRGDTLYVYYGCADQYVCLATCSLKELISCVMENPV